MAGTSGSTRRSDSQRIWIALRTHRLIGWWGEGRKEGALGHACGRSRSHMNPWGLVNSHKLLYAHAYNPDLAAEPAWAGSSAPRCEG